MLVLSRKPGERILIGSDIEVSVLSIQGNRVRLAIDCPTEIRVLRGEVMPIPDPVGIPRYVLETTRMGMSH
jgi:carbon storage regulator